MNTQLLDDFTDLSGWTAIASGQARLTIGPEPGRRTGAMRLEFDFQSGGGFVVARKAFALTLPESYAIDLGIRGRGPANILEFKLVDSSGQNVWRYREEAFAPPEDWFDLRIASRQVPFAWGPLGGGPPRDIAAIELVIAAGPGGAGALWVEDLRLTDTTYRLTPLVAATSARPGCEACHVLDPSPAIGWRSLAGEAPQRLTLDFQCEREYGGLVVRWDPARRPQGLSVQLSSDGSEWRTGFETWDGVGKETPVALPEAHSRYVALELRPDPERDGVGIQSIEIQPHDFSRSPNDFCAAIAQRAAPGRYPKYLLGRQTYWTPVGTGADVTQALFNEEGLVEIDKGACSVEPFLHVDGQLVTWADAELTQGLEQGYLPLPFSDWRRGDLGLRVSACATEIAGASCLFIRYRVANEAERARRVTLFAAIRPFQVTPTWQHWRRFGGVSPIGRLALVSGRVCIDGRQWIVPLTAPSGFGAATFAQGTITEFLEPGALPPREQVDDPVGQASGALRFDLELTACSAREIVLAVPLGGLEAERAAVWSSESSGAEAFERARANWARRLDVLEIALPPQAGEVGAAFKTAAAHILISRDGPALQPGPRRYSRAWIRDGALMGAALARAGHPEAGRDFIRWYAGFQTEDGNLPDCVDREGSEWLPEFDAWGEFIFAVMDHYRFSDDRAFLAELWPAVRRCVDTLERLRGQRLTSDYQSGPRRACYGLLPESMSHEGYMAHPVHAYWDDFWAVRGFKDAAEMAEILGEQEQARRIAALRDAFVETLHASLDLVIAEHGLEFLPGSVELADFDPTASAIGITLADELHRLPRPIVERTFARYLDGFRARVRDEAPWSNYSAYEIRIIGALVRLGWRDEARELLDFFLADRRIRPWHQWPEISWRDPLGPSFIGDMPHSWIGAEYILAVRSLFVYERDSDQTLVIAAGLPEDWMMGGEGIRVRDLPTQHGPLGYILRQESEDCRRVSLCGDLAVPSGGIILSPPLPRPLVRVEINGEPSGDFGPDWVACHLCPAEVLLWY